MDNFNKILSFVLGLVVVIVFLAIITGRFDVKKRFQGFGAKTNVTPTKEPTKTAESTSLSPAPTAIITTRQYSNVTIAAKPAVIAKRPATIPSTGSPTLLIPLLASTFGFGVFLKRKS